tara:strand:- start:1135 stop:1872 length:738 start_codon:yes stop_codon:yes gene_type:complete
MNYKIVIPSYERLNAFFKKTYTKIITNYQLENVYVFVSCCDDLNEYKKKYPELNIILSPKGYGETINFITEYFDMDTKYVLMGDDINRFTICEGTKLKPVEDLNKVIIETFEIMEKEKCNLGGFYPTPNGLWCSKAIIQTTDLRFIHDAFCLIINKKILVNPNLMKIDFQRTILYYQYDNKVLRRNRYSFSTAFLKGKGGNQQERLMEKEKALEFYEEYKPYIRRLITHKSGSSSFLLNPTGKKN